MLESEGVPVAEAGSSIRFRSIALAALAAGGVLLPIALLAVASFGLLPGQSTAQTRDVAAGSDQALTAAYGASGILPQTAELNAAMLENITSGDDIAAGIPDGALVIPPVTLAAYQRAESALALEQPGCKVSWTLLAGLGRVISDHGGGGLDPTGNSLHPIVGPQLDGSFGLANIGDTDDGQFDGDIEWDRASGPMQIIPSLWRQIGADSDGDGVGSPHNVFDAALAAGRYVCADGADLGELPAQAHAVFRYQQSEVFARAVMAWTQVYGQRLAPGEPPLLALPPVQDIGPQSAKPPAGSLPPGNPQPPASLLPPPAAPSPEPGTSAGSPRSPRWPMPGPATEPMSEMPPATRTTAPTTTGRTTTGPGTTTTDPGTTTTGPGTTTTGPGTTTTDSGTTTTGSGTTTTGSGTTTTGSGATTPATP